MLVRLLVCLRLKSAGKNLLFAEKSFDGRTLKVFFFVLTTMSNVEKMKMQLDTFRANRSYPKQSGYDRFVLLPLVKQKSVPGGFQAEIGHQQNTA
jgi:hypothetical protein